MRKMQSLLLTAALLLTAGATLGYAANGRRGSCSNPGQRGASAGQSGPRDGSGRQTRSRQGQAGTGRGGVGGSQRGAGAGMGNGSWR